MAEEKKNSEESEIKEDSKLYGEFDSIESFTNNGLKSIVETTKAINALPTGEARDLYCAYPAFCKIIDGTSNRILELISKVIKHENMKGNIHRRQFDDKYELLTECNDIILERANSNLDEYADVKKNMLIDIAKTSSTYDSRNFSNSGEGCWNFSKFNRNIPQSTAFLASKQIPRPQLNFKTQIDNSCMTPFEPKIKEKPNSLKPLAILPEYNEDGEIESYLHPYEFELMKFKPSKELLEKSIPNLPKKIENTEFELVENVEQLRKVLSDLRTANEIAIDIEHHSYRSFQGFSCLIQISTRRKDYIIDGISLRDELHILNEVFTNPKILKIFHGADLDIQWLQRDFALYVVNMFDTHQAAKILQMPKLSLAYLLKHYCDIDADKSFQLADWRIRPLPENFIYYARQDTHFLIYIYELLRNELITRGNDQKNLLNAVYQRSTEICKKRYVKPTISTDSYLEFYHRSKKLYDNRQLFALKEIFNWRDKVARNEDESYSYVLPNHMLLQICENLPREMQGILACCNPVPPLVKQNLLVLHQIILKARDQPLIKPILREEITCRINTNNTNWFSFQDLRNHLEFRDDLPTLIDSNLEVIKNEIDENLNLGNPIINLFETSETESDVMKKKLDEIRKKTFITPYQRYKAIIPYAEQQRLKEIEREENLKKSMELYPGYKKEKETKNEMQELNVEESKPLIQKALKRKLQDESTSSKQIKIESEDASSERKSKKKKSEIKIENMSNTNPIENEKICNDSKTEITNAIVEDNNTKSSDKKDLKSDENPDKSKKPRLKQSSSQPVEKLDLEKVDFSIFKGGTKKSQSSNEIKFQGKGKISSHTNKKLNKMFTFASNKKR